MRGRKRSLVAPTEKDERADTPEAPPRWQEIHERLMSQAHGALKESVNQKLGLSPRGGATDADEPGERFLRFILNQVPADRRKQVEKIFRLIGREAELRNNVAIFLRLMDIAAKKLANLGHPVGVSVVVTSPKQSGRQR